MRIMFMPEVETSVEDNPEDVSESFSVDATWGGANPHRYLKIVTVVLTILNFSKHIFRLWKDGISISKVDMTADAYNIQRIKTSVGTKVDESIVVLK